MAGLREIFIQNLKYYRKQKNMRQLDLALELGKNPNYINAIENGKYFPSPETIEEIAEFLEIEPISLFARETKSTEQVPPSETVKPEQTIDLKSMEFKLKEMISDDITKVFASISA